MVLHSSFMIQIHLIKTMINNTTKEKDLVIMNVLHQKNLKFMIKVFVFVDYFTIFYFMFFFCSEKCWFCLSSSSVEKHLIVTVGQHFYIALAKGPINETHCLLLPITHIQSSALLSKESWEELDKFKDALRKVFRSNIKFK